MRFRSSGMSSRALFRSRRSAVDLLGLCRTDTKLACRLNMLA